MTSRVAPKAMISLRDKFNLSPIEKHIEYKRFPYKLILHTFLVFLTTTQVLVMVDSEYTAHAREQARMFKFLLLESTAESNYEKFLTVGNFQDHLISLVDTFQNMNDLIYQNYFDDDIEASIAIYYIVSGSHVFPVDFDSGVVGPLNPNDPTSIKYWTSVANLAELHVNNIKTTINTSPTSYSCMSWNITIAYNFETFSQISAEIKTYNKYCAAAEEGESNIILGEFRKGNYFINILVGIASIISLLLSIKHVYSVSRLYMAARFRYQGVQKKKDNPKFKLQMDENTALLDTSNPELKLKKFLDLDTPWEKLPLFQRLQFFNFWIIFGAIGNCIQLLGSISVTLTFSTNVGQEILYRDNIFVGFGCFFAWIQVMYYLQFSKDIILLSSTFQKSLTENLVFLGFVVPLFIGLAILCQSLYYNYDRFETTGSTIISLISMACGCLVYEIFHDTFDAGVLRQLFLYFYFFALYTSVQNIFVSIIMEGYDRCTVRKELDNDDPFPIADNIRRKSKKKETPPPTPRLLKSHTEPPSSFSMLYDEATPRTPREVNSSNRAEFPDIKASSLEVEKESLNHCLNELYYKKEQVYILLLELRQAYAEVQETPFGRDDRVYLEHLYTESLNKILIRMKRDETLIDLKKHSFQEIRNKHG